MSSSIVMSCISRVFLVLLLRVQSLDLTHARSFSSPLPFELPEIDGSPVDTCRIFFVPSPDTTTTTTATATTATTTTTAAPTTTTTRAITNKLLEATTKKPAVQSQQKNPETKNTGTPIRPQPAPTRPITDSHSNLLYYLLANSRRRGSLPGFNSFVSQPMGGQPQGGGSTSESDELVKRVGRKDEKRWKVGSSEDSSDES
uniref:protein let-653-like n=1 Tax=Scatophagus argus TaxID=75038 RepID=UPI001ED8413A|nr:protein let-653-like [Scatophagus argus]